MFKEKLVLIKSILLGFAPIWVTIGLICKFGFNLESLTCGAIFAQVFFSWIVAEIMHSQGRTQYAPQLKLEHHHSSALGGPERVSIHVVNIGKYPAYNLSIKLSHVELSGNARLSWRLQNRINLDPNGGRDRLIIISISEYMEYVESKFEIEIRCTDILGGDLRYLFQKPSKYWDWLLISFRDLRRGILLSCYDDLLTAYRSWRKRNTLNTESLSAVLVYCDKDKV